MSDINPPLPDYGPTDGTHGESDDSQPIDESLDNLPEDDDDAPEPALTDDGALSPGTTADGSPTSLD